jgi:hypothetical protein
MHTINSLMQWPAVARADLERIAAEMDAAEGSLLTDESEKKKKITSAKNTPRTLTSTTTTTLAM